MKMKKLSIILLGVLFVFLFSACGGNNTNTEKTDENKKEEIADTKEDKNETLQKTPTELIVGSWYDETSISGFDIIFNEDGTLLWHSGSDEGEDSWKITEEGKFNYFAEDYEILELTEEVFKITDGEVETTFVKMDE